jgi:hypothetical protein
MLVILTHFVFPLCSGGLSPPAAAAFDRTRHQVPLHVVQHTSNHEEEYLQMGSYFHQFPGHCPFSVPTHLDVYFNEAKRRQI